MVARLRLKRIEISNTEASLAATKAIEPHVREVSRRVLNRSRALTPVRTGQLRARQRVVMRITRTHVQAQIEARTSYAMFVHDGTRPHEIRPKRVSTLRWVSGGSMYQGGGIHFAKVVHHPGTKGSFFMRRALEEVAGPAGFRIGAQPSSLEVLDLSS